MIFSSKEQFVLATISISMFQSAYADHHISEAQCNLYAQQACGKLGATTSIIFSKEGRNINPFEVIRQMDADKKNFVKKFLYDIFDKTKKSDRAAFYFVQTLEKSGLTS